MYEYVYIDRQLDLAEVKEFLETCHLYEEFVKKFGVPNAYRYTAFYELPPEEGEPRYLEIYYHEKTREISCVNIVSHVKYKGTLWEAETDNTGNG